jgi:hypothetical protein
LLSLLAMISQYFICRTEPAQSRVCIKEDVSVALVRLLFDKF